MLQEKLSCLGCHRFGSAGGRIAPDLMTVNNRLSAHDIRRMIEHPQQAVPSTIMPKTRLTPQSLDLLVAYLAKGPVAEPPAIHASPSSPPPTPIANPEEMTGATLYDKYCSACHGVEGRGDGYNAPFLSSPPANLADPVRMGQRPDDTLFDGIAAGGRVMGISHRMPAWGDTLAAADIRQLVRHIRTLCDCRGPEWSQDGR